MKVLFVTILLTFAAFVAAHGPHDEMEQLLCESQNTEVVNELKKCWNLAPKAYQDLFHKCRETHSAVSDEELCRKWEEVMKCSHEGHGHEETDYEETSKCVLKLYKNWKHGQS
ncbi:uncharacterized protein LOC143250229 isoform X2 [Tachypleus tridentatus]|uniref:uncharacterized protein LOC143250229 isoform X2 n=1 Tax=Tachypleus tridentatus TaxID=6853 RepID=UPI003FD4DFF1